MTSLHRRFPAWLSREPYQTSASLLPCVLSMHYSTARPLEVRLRIPLAIAHPEHDGPGTWAAWPVDRIMLKASAWVVGSAFGPGDVRVGTLLTNPLHWVANLSRRGRFVAQVGTFGPAVRDFVADTERLAPTGQETVDVDAFLADVLGGAAS